MALPTQTTYTSAFPAAFAGMIGSEPDVHVESAVNGEASNLPAGILVVEDAALAKTARLMTAATGVGAKLLGAIVNTFFRDPGNLSASLGGTNDAFLPGVALPLLTRGQIWLVSESAFTVGDDVFVRHTVNGGLTQKGAVTSGAGVTTGCRKMTGARVILNSTAAGVVLVELDVNVDRASV